MPDGGRSGPGAVGPSPGRARWWSALALGAAVMGAGPRTAAAQIISGVVLDDYDTSPVPGAMVVLLDTAGIEFMRMRSDSTGAFAFPLPAPGRYSVLAQRMGYSPLLSPVLEVPRDTLGLELRVLPVPVALEPVRVTAAARRMVLEAAGFYERKRLGIGRFVTAEEIGDAQDRLSEVLRMEPSVDVLIDFASATGTGSRVVFRGARRGLTAGSGGSCYPTIVLDGMKVRDSGMDGIALDELIHPAEVAALELYPSGAGAPVQWSGMDAGCGLIILWTHRRRP